MFDALYPDAADSALAIRAGQPPVQPPTPWFQGFWGAMGSAPVRAGLETGRALKTVAPLQVGNPLAMSPTEQEGMLEDEGINRRNMDRGLRIAIEGMTPDPESTGAASMLLHEVTRFVSKAVGYAAAGGPVGAVAGMTLDEGYNEAARRMDEGVDAATAARLGVTKGIASGIAVALPVAGKTLAQTLGLAAAGGPASFVAEQATAREILRSANYDELAGEIDPFDPMGLGVAFFGSLLFGGAAHGMRGARAKADAAAADARMLAADTAPGKPAEVAQAARAYTPEQVDAAHVSILQAHRDGSALHRADDIASSAGHARALDRATEQMTAGERVSVADAAPVAVRDLEVFDRLDEIETLRTEVEALLPVAGELADRGAIREIRAELKELERARPDEGPAAERALAKEIQAQQGISYKAALSEAKKQIAGTVADHEAKIERLQQAVESNARAQQATQRVGEIEKRVVDLERTLGPDLRLARFERSVGRAVREAVETAAKEQAALAPKAVPQPKPEAPTAKPAAQPGAAPAKAGPDAPAAPAKPSADAANEPVQPAPAAADYLAREADAIAQVDPDMLVMMEGMERPVKVSELLAEARAMVDQEIADAPLMKVAAECALRG